MWPSPGPFLCPGDVPLQKGLGVLPLPSAPRPESPPGSSLGLSFFPKELVVLAALTSSVLLGAESMAACPVAGPAGGAQSCPLEGFSVHKSQTSCPEPCAPPTPAPAVQEGL